MSIAVGVVPEQSYVVRVADADRALPHAERVALQAAVKARIAAGETQAGIGRAIGASQASINKLVLSAEVGAAVGRKLCAYLGTSLERLVEVHRAEVEAAGSAARPFREVEREDRYPSRPGALVALEAAGVEVDVIRYVASMRAKSDEDPGAAYWARDAVREAREILTLARESAGNRPDPAFGAVVKMPTKKKR